RIRRTVTLIGFDARGEAESGIGSRPPHSPLTNSINRSRTLSAVSASGAITSTVSSPAIVPTIMPIRLIERHRERACVRGRGLQHNQVLRHSNVQQKLARYHCQIRPTRYRFHLPVAVRRL